MKERRKLKDKAKQQRQGDKFNGELYQTQGIIKINPSQTLLKFQREGDIPKPILEGQDHTDFIRDSLVAQM